MELDELIEKAKQQDEYATSELFRMTYKKAYIEALSFMKDEDRASEALQIAYINIFKNIDKLKDSKTFYKWVNTTVANTCKNELKKRKEFTFSDYDETSDEGLSLEVEDESRNYKPDESVNYEDDRDVVMGFIDELPTEQKAALVLQVYEDMKISEIAEIFDTNENTIKSRLNYAKKTLKEKITEYKKKGNTLFAMPLVPYIHGILKAYEDTLLINEETGKGILGFLGFGAGAAASETSSQKTKETATQEQAPSNKATKENQKSPTNKKILRSISSLSTMTKVLIVGAVMLVIGIGVTILTSLNTPSNSSGSQIDNDAITDSVNSKDSSIQEAILEESDETYIKYLVQTLSYDDSESNFYMNFTQNVDDYINLLSLDTLKALNETGHSETLKINEEDINCEDPLDSDYITSSIGTIKNQETVELKVMPETNKDITITSTDNSDEYKVYLLLDNHDYCEVIIKREKTSFFGYTVLEYTVDDQRYVFNDYKPTTLSSVGSTTSIENEQQACRYVFENDFAIDYDEVKDNKEGNTVAVIGTGSTENYGQYYQIKVDWEQGNIYIYYVFSQTGKIVCLTDIENEDLDVKAQSVDSNFNAVNVVVSHY